MTARPRPLDDARGVNAASPLPARRISLPGMQPERLYFGQVHEDPVLELEALQPSSNDRLVVVTSGGCTALALLGAGAGRVDAVDLSPAQNHLVELKLAALATLPHDHAVQFLGGWKAKADWRLETYRQLRAYLSATARDYWDREGRGIASGVLNAGVSERFIGALRRLLRLAVHPRRRIERLLALQSEAERRRFYRDEWDTRRWRALFTLLLNRRSFERRYDPGFFRGVERSDFSEHLHRRFEHTVTELSVGDNYFLHVALTGRYSPDALPRYLTPAGGASAVAAASNLLLVDGSVTDHLRTLPDESVTGYALSNVCEWMDEAQIDELFRQVARTAVPGATVCFRNFVGWTEVPRRWRHEIVEDRALGETLLERDRSLVNRRFAVCRAGKRNANKLLRLRTGVRVRTAGPDDNAGLVALATACPMRGRIALCVDREPDYFALNRLRGDDWRVGVVDTPDGRIIGTVAVASRRVYLNGIVRRICYVSDLKVHPRWRDGDVADALTRWVRVACSDLAGSDAPCLLTILEGNRAMERRASGPRGTPRLTRIGTIDAWSIPLVLPRRTRSNRRLTIARAAPDDQEDMADLWERVAPGRQFAHVCGPCGRDGGMGRPPGLDLDAYLVARDIDGRIAGFLGLWDQHELKQLRVVRYDTRLGAVRQLLNLGAPFLRGTRLPPPGEALRSATSVHTCVPAARPEVLRALLLHGMPTLRRAGHAFVMLGLDCRDPLAGALRGLWAQPSRVGVYLTSATGAYEGPEPDGRPLHFEIALV